MAKMQNFIIWIQTASLFIKKQKIFIQILHKMLEQNLTNYNLDRPLKDKKVVPLMTDELGVQIMKEFVGLRAKTYSYVKDNNDEDKKSKRHK